MSGNRRWFDGRPQAGNRRARGKPKPSPVEGAGTSGPNGDQEPKPGWLAEEQPHKDEWHRTALDLDAGLPDWLAASRAGGPGVAAGGGRIIATPGPTERPDWLADYQPSKRDWSPARDRFEAELVRLARKAEEKRRRRRAWLGGLAASDEDSAAPLVDSSQAAEMAEPQTPYFRRAADFTSAAVSAAGEMWKRRATERAQVAEARARLQAQRQMQATRAQALAPAPPVAAAPAPGESPAVTQAQAATAAPAPPTTPEIATPLPFEIVEQRAPSAVPPPPEMPAESRGTWSVRPPATSEPPTQVIRPRRAVPPPPEAPPATPPAPAPPVPAPEPLTPAPTAAPPPPPLPPPPPPPPVRPMVAPDTAAQVPTEVPAPPATPPAPVEPAAPAAPESGSEVRPWVVRPAAAARTPAVAPRTPAPPPAPRVEVNAPEPVVEAESEPEPEPELRTPLPPVHQDLDLGELRGRNKRGFFSSPFAILGGMREEIKEIQSKRDLEREQERSTILQTIRELPDEGYQKMVLDIFRRDGYLILKAEDNVSGVIDLECQRHGERVFVQHRRRGDLLQAEDRVREVHEAVVAAGADGGFVFTDGSFTWGADELARQTGIVLVDGNVLVDLMEEITVADAEKDKKGLGKALGGIFK